MRVAFVVQRYGSEISGGAEAHCRKVACRLSQRWDVEVLTTCAADYTTWKNEYPAGVEEIDGVTVRRFPVSWTREPWFFNRCYDFAVSLLLRRRGLAGPLPGSPAEIDWDAVDLAQPTRAQHSHWLIRWLAPVMERLWMKEQGPFAPELLRFLRRNRRRYDRFVFFSYNYATTYFGLPLVGRRAVLVPTLHDEPAARFGIFRRFFGRVPTIFFNTTGERELAGRLFPAVGGKDTSVVGVGIDLAEPSPWDDVARRYGIVRPFALYAGRIEGSKGAPLLFERYRALRERHPVDLDLVLIGSAEMEVPCDPSIRFLGFVPEADKSALLAHATLLVNPSPFESLSMIILESWAVGTPVLVNEVCDIMVDHCDQSGGGLVFGDQPSFDEAFLQIARDERFRARLGAAGQEYVRRHYNWARVEDHFLKLAPPAPSSAGRALTVPDS